MTKNQGPTKLPNLQQKIPNVQVKKANGKTT